MFVASASEHVATHGPYFWIGMAVAPSTGTTYANLNNDISKGWQGVEQFSGNSEAGTAISDAATIVSVTLYVTNAPGTGNSWTLKIRQNIADTTAAAVVSGSATSATWTGSLSLAQLDWVDVSITSSGSPATAGTVYWTIQYNPVGSDYYLMPGWYGGNQTFLTFGNPAAGTSPYSGTATDNEIVVPTALTVAKIAGSHVQGAGGASGYAYCVRKNDTTDSSTVNVLSAAVTTISMAFAAGDRMVIKRTNVDASQWVTAHFCLTIIPGTTGEQIMCFSSLAVPSTSAVQYQPPAGEGASAWDSTESNVAAFAPGCTLSKVYAKVVTAPGTSKSYTFRVRSNGADTTAVAIIAGTNTTGNDTVDSATHIAGNKLSISMTPTSTPTSTTGARVSFVAVPT